MITTVLCFGDPCLLSHSPLDVIVLMLGGNDTKAEFGRSAAQITVAAL